MNACIPEINQSGREMQGTYLGSSYEISVFLNSTVFKHIFLALPTTRRQTVGYVQEALHNWNKSD